MIIFSILYQLGFLSDNIYHINNISTYIQNLYLPLFLNLLFSIYYLFYEFDFLYLVSISNLFIIYDNIYIIQNYNIILNYSPKIRYVINKDNNLLKTYLLSFLIFIIYINSILGFIITISINLYLINYSESCFRAYNKKLITKYSKFIYYNYLLILLFNQYLSILVILINYNIIFNYKLLNVYLDNKNIIIDKYKTCSLIDDILVCTINKYYYDDFLLLNYNKLI